MLDEISDEELLQFMQEQFDSVCFGDLDYLEGTCLEIFAQASNNTPLPSVAAPVYTSQMYCQTHCIALPIQLPTLLTLPADKNPL